MKNSEHRYQRLCILIIIYFFIVTPFLASCGGGGGDNGENEASSQTDQVMAVLEKENETATEFASQSISYFDAVEEYLEAIENETGGIDLDGMTVEDLVNIIGQEQVDALAEATASIYSQKIVPAANAMSSAYYALLLSEQQYEDFLDPDAAASMMQPAAFFTVPVVCAAGGILLTGVGTTVYCVNEVIKERNACEQGYLAQGYSENIAGVACILQNPKAIVNCGKDIAVSAYTTILSGGAAGFKKIQLSIDAFSATDAFVKIKTLFGQRSDNSTQGFGNQNVNESMISVAAAQNPYATYFIGTSEDGTFLVPEGDWSFMAVADGYARGIIGPISVSGDEEIIKESVTMVPSDEATELVDDYDADGYTSCQGDCKDNDSSIYPGAAEIESDGIDQDCDGKDAVPVPDEYVVWYMDNVRCWDAPRVYATHRDDFNLEKDTCDVPGGGRNCDIKVDKVEMQSGFSTLEEAQDWFCPQITTEWYHYWCNSRGSRVEISGGDLYTLQIPCDLTDVPYEYP